MFEPKDLSIAELKRFHRTIREKVECAKEDTNPANKWMRAIDPEYNQIKAEGRMVLGMIDKEFDRRGYDVEKLFKGYKTV